VLIGELSRHAAFDAVIAPSLYLREARVDGRSASWDAVERPLEIEGAERLPADLPLEGAAPAASLHVAVFDAQGNKLQEAIGGLELLVRVRVTRKRNAGPGELSVRYLSSADAYLDAMSRALRDGTSWTSSVHSLKGASANLGALRVAALARAAEHQPPDAATLQAIRHAVDEVGALFGERQRSGSRH